MPEPLSDEQLARLRLWADPAGHLGPLVLALIEEVEGLRAEVPKLHRELAEQEAMHQAYQPEVVAEVAVQLTEEADWEEIARWCGGKIVTAGNPSGEYTSTIVVNGDTASEGAWITLGHDGVFRVRWAIDQPAPLSVSEGGSDG